MASPLRLLIVEDRPEDAELVVAELRRSGYLPAWRRVDCPEGFVDGLAEDPDVVICDYALPLIVVSGVMDEETCVNSLRLGAVDYLLKDRLVRLGPAVEHALARRRLTG